MLKMERDTAKRMKIWALKGSYSKRRKWNTGDVNIHVVTEEEKNQQISEKHEEYLLLLQHKNRAAKKLKVKDPKQLSLEKKEKGFSLYLNGANEDIAIVKDKERHHQTTGRKTARKQKPKTASDRRTNCDLIYAVGGNNLHQTEDNTKTRAKTAPEKTRRRNWAVESLDIKTSRGERVKVKAPEILTGNYEDDFETYVSESFNGHSYQSNSDTDSLSDTDTESISSEDQMEKGAKRIVRVKGDGSGDISSESARYNRAKQRRTDGAEGRGGEQMTLSVKDVKKLRQSLEMNTSIRESLARQAAEADSDSDRDSPIPEEDEEEDDSDSEIEEAVGVQDSLEPPKAALHNRKVVFKPSDMVVLDFGQAKKEQKDRQLSAARKKADPDSYGALKSGSGTSSNQRPTSGRKSTPYRESTQKGTTHTNQSASSRGNSGILKNKTPTPIRGQKKDDVVLNAASAPGKKPRPLSAQRKSTTADQMDSTQETKAVMEAMRQENQRMDREKERKKASNTPRSSQNDDPSPVLTPRQSNSVPSPSTSMSWKDKLKPTQTSAEIAKERKENMRMIGTQLASLDLDCDLDEIVSKVLQLDSKGQRKLLQALQHIEEGTKITKELQPIPESKPKRTPPKLKKKEKSGNKIHILIEVLTNWGHRDRVGLTEIEMFDLNKKKISVDLDDVLAEGIEDPSGDVANIFNGKCKTVKERHMLNWNKNHDEPIEFTIMVPNYENDPNFGISKIKIWNYNRSLNDLSMGVKEVKVSVDGSVKWHGTLDKGCGNQVFDYSKTIIVTETDSTTSDSPRDNNNSSSSSKVPQNQKQTKLQNGANVNGKSSNNNGADTPVMDNVSLFHSVDSARGQRSDTRTVQRSKDGVLDLPVIDHDDVQNRNLSPKTDGKGLSPRSSKADRIKSGMRNETATSLKNDKSKGMSVVIPESVSEPRQRHRKKKERKSKIAARLSGGSSMDSSASISMTRSADPYLQNSSNSEIKASQNSAVITSSSSNQLTRSHSDETSSKTITPPSPRSSEKVSGSMKSRDLPNNKASVSKSRDLPANPEPKQITAVKQLEVDTPARPGSGLGMSDDESMLQQIRNLNVKEKEPTQKSKGVPLWLKQDKLQEASYEAPIESSRGKKSASDTNILDNWPQAGVGHLKTVLDSEKPPSSSGSSSARKSSSATANTNGEKKAPEQPLSARKHEPKAVPAVTKLDIAESSDEDFDIDKEVEVEMSRMQQIESARKQWRQKEEKKLEESWSSLSIFNKLHKGRISLDVEDDILDEYLNSERNKPKEATIQEEPESDEMLEDASNEGHFEIPELPKGKEFVVDIQSTWGDRHYVGLNGIEIFTNTGEIASVSKIWAEPLDINVLPEYSKDPRVVSNLLDGINRTRDDTHMWLAPYIKGGKHKVFITFEKPVTVAMLRIWNYNKSRIHSYRGAKDIEISLDGRCIFKGEIARACGGIVGGTDAFGDTILFTMDEDILESVSQYDQAFESELLMDDNCYDDETDERPSTADKGVGGRPFTAAANQRSVPKQQSVQAVPVDIVDGDVLVLRGQCLKLNFTVTWGDIYYLGLTGLEIVDKDGEAIPVNLSMLDADPRDLHVLPGYERDDRTLDKLIDGTNITMSDEHMWLVPYTEGEEHVLQINFNKPTELTGLRIWNYNKSSECTYRGAKIVHAYLDGRQISPPEGFLIRKGPGNCNFDFAQEISFTEPCTPRVTAVQREAGIKVNQSTSEDATQEYEVVQKPCGFIYQFQLLSTWGDQYYCGLNGLQFYDSGGNLIELTDNNISAYPDSVNALPSVENDVRTPDKLIDGMYDTRDGSHMWLAPMLPGMLNRVYVIFDQPMEISMIKLWNYSKTANRGVKDFALLVDDLLVYNGTLEMVQNRAILPTVDAPQSHHTILFTDDKDIRRKEKHAVIRNQAGEQDVQLMNDCKVMTQKKTHLTKPVDQALRPKTSVTRLKKR